MTGAHPIFQEILDDFQAAATGRYNPNARAYEAFAFDGPRTLLLEPLEAESLNDALAEVTGRWAWSRGQRIGVREIGDKVDQLHIYAVRQKSAPDYSWREHSRQVEYKRYLDHVCSIDLNIVAGIDLRGVGTERELFERRQDQRPGGSRFSR